jgi:hypothetical protein
VRSGSSAYEHYFVLGINNLRRKKLRQKMKMRKEWKKRRMGKQKGWKEEMKGQRKHKWRINQSWRGEKKRHEKKIKQKMDQLPVAKFLRI